MKNKTIRNATLRAAMLTAFSALGSAQMEFERYEFSVNGAGDWNKELMVLVNPCDIDCSTQPVDWATCVDGSTEFLNVTSFEAFVVPPNQVLTRVWVDVLARYDQGQMGRFRIQLEHGTAGVIFTDETGCVTSGPQGNCRWQFNGPGSPHGVDVTSQVLAAEPNRNQIDQIDMRVRRFNPGCSGATGLKVKAFRMVFRTEADCDSNGLADIGELNSFSDCDGDMVLDRCEAGYRDCNNNGRWDVCDSGYSDCNQNSIMDSCELNNSTDLNGNGVLDECECFTLNFCSASPNSVRIEGAIVGLLGTPSLSSSSPLSLRTTFLPPNTFGVFVMGTGIQSPVVLGDGLLCLSQSGGNILTRLHPAVQADALGVAERQLAIPGPYLSGLSPGDTRHFQLWYRDHAFGGAGYNWSNGITVNFCD